MSIITQIVTKVQKATQNMLPTPIIGTEMVIPRALVRVSNVRISRFNSLKAIRPYADRTLRLAVATNDKNMKQMELAI